MSRIVTKTKIIVLLFALIILGLAIFIWLKPSYPANGTIVLTNTQNEEAVDATVTIEAENGRVHTVKYENIVYYADLGTTREGMESQHNTNMEQFDEINTLDGFEAGYVYEDDYYITESYFDATVADIKDIIEHDEAVSEEDDLRTESYIKHLEGLGLELE